MCAALDVLHYIHSTHDFGIHFTSSSTDPVHTFVHFPDSSDVEAYTDAKPPSPSHQSPLTSYSDACWGSQIGSAVRDGTLLPLFKIRSMSGGIIFRQGGPIACMAVCQERTSLSSCEAEIRATNEILKLLMGIRHLADAVREGGHGHDIADTVVASHLYRDIEACVRWSNNMTTKQIRHMEMRENAVREWVQDASLKVLHVSGRINPADIFTKEMRGGAHFRRLRDSFMCPLSKFLQQSLLDVHLSRQHDEPRPLQLLPSAAPSSASHTRGSYLLALLSFPLAGTLTAISHLSSSGRHIFLRFTEIR